MATHADIAVAIAGLRPRAKFSLQGDTYEGLTWLDEEQTKPTEAEIAAYVPPPPAPKITTSLLYEHENRLRSIEGLPPLTLDDFVHGKEGL
jgi:hypothetical protein